MNLEDKILGEKLNYYCSSSDSEGEEDSDEYETCASAADKPEHSHSDRSFNCSGTANTGPKGVIQDWQKFKQLENEKIKQKEIEKLELFNKLSITCSCNNEENEDLSEKELLDDSIFKEYMQKRMAEVYQNMKHLPSYGHVFHLSNGQEFLDAVDNVPKEVTVVVHLYEENIPSCEAMNGCLTCLAQDHVKVKFCKLKASTARVSSHFQSTGCPALLVYKNGQMIGNFVRLEDEFGEDFFAADVENFLVEHGMLTDKTLVPSVINSNLDND